MPDQTALEARQGEAALSFIERKPKTCDDDLVGVEPQNPSGANNAEKREETGEYQIDLEECIANLISKAGSLH